MIKSHARFEVELSKEKIAATLLVKLCSQHKNGSRVDAIRLHKEALKSTDYFLKEPL